MHLTREALDIWAADTRAKMTRPGRPEGWTRLLVLAEGDSVYSPSRLPPGIGGPAVVELVVFRDGGWNVREMVTETPESIALAASLAQRALPMTPARVGKAARIREAWGADPPCNCNKIGNITPHEPWCARMQNRRDQI